MKPTVCVDLDGVLFDTDMHGPYVPDRFGRPVNGARQFLSELRKTAWVVIFTARFCDAGRQHHDIHHLKSIVADALQLHGLEYDEIWTEVGKPVAVAYVDDRAVACRPLEHPSTPACFSETLAGVAKLMTRSELPKGLVGRLEVNKER
jgi:hypothetical protein